MDFWQFFWLVIEIFVFAAYIVLFFHIITDLFRDTRMGGFAKAVWVLLLIALPFISALCYLIFRGRGMEERRIAAAANAQRSMDDYIRKTAGTNPAQEIAEAHQLLQSGAISQGEFDALKAKVLS